MLFRLNFLLMFSTHLVNCQNHEISLKGNERRETYKLIESAFGSNSIETPDCSHDDDPPVEHITQRSGGGQGQPTGGSYFVFVLHATPDSDNCNSSSTKQRTEIAISETDEDTKPALATRPRQHRYHKWEFNVSATFASPNQLTDIHQIQAKTKAGPAISLIRLVLTTFPNNGSTMLQVRSGSKVVCSTDYSRFLNQWVSVSEGVTYALTADEGGFRLTITTKNGGRNVLDCPRSEVLWSDDYVHIRPKWGIKRRKFDGRSDVEVSYNNFLIQSFDDLDF